MGIEFRFAYQSFKWVNNAKGNAGVTVIIIGLRNSSNKEKKLFTTDNVILTKNINPYLSIGNSLFVTLRKHSLAINFPKMVMGSMARDGGNLILSTEEKDKILEDFPDLVSIIRKLYGAQEFIQGKERYCLWIEDNQLSEVENISPVKERIRKVYEVRISSKAKTTNGYASISHKFAQRSHQKLSSIIIPSVSSARREYIPMGFLDAESVIIAPNLAIYKFI